jgi:hypothetical protein
MKIRAMGRSLRPDLANAVCDRCHKKPPVRLCDKLISQEEVAQLASHELRSQVNTWAESIGGGARLASPSAPDVGATHPPAEDRFPALPARSQGGSLRTEKARFGPFAKPPVHDPSLRIPSIAAPWSGEELRFGDIRDYGCPSSDDLRHIAGLPKEALDHL